MHVTLDHLKESDLEGLHGWMNQSHLKPFYMRENINLDDVREKFQPRIEGNHYCSCLIATFNDNPFGYIQWYLNDSVPDYGVSTKGYDDGVSFDYFIGDPKFLGKGLGHQMLKTAVEQVANQVDLRDRRFFLIHDLHNHAALRCSGRAGFEMIDKIIYDDRECGIYHRTS